MLDLSNYSRAECRRKTKERYVQRVGRLQNVVLLSGLTNPIRAKVEFLHPHTLLLSPPLHDQPRINQQNRAQQKRRTAPDLRAAEVSNRRV